MSYHAHMDRAAEIMLSHSNAGTIHVMDSARHFFLTRFMYEGLTHDTVTEAQYDRLVDEAWVIFILPAIQSYHTWLKDVMEADPYMDEMVNEILEDIRHDWSVEMESLKSHFLEDLS